MGLKVKLAAGRGLAFLGVDLGMSKTQMPVATSSLLSHGRQTDCQVFQPSENEENLFSFN